MHDRSYKWKKVCRVANRNSLYQMMCIKSLSKIASANPQHPPPSALNSSSAPFFDKALLSGFCNLEDIQLKLKI